MMDTFRDQMYWHQPEAFGWMYLLPVKYVWFAILGIWGYRCTEPGNSLSAIPAASLSYHQHPCLPWLWLGLPLIHYRFFLLVHNLGPLQTHHTHSLLELACPCVTNLSGTYGTVGQPCVHTQGSLEILLPAG
jgi:hypothetical protein